MNLKLKEKMLLSMLVPLVVLIFGLSFYAYTTAKTNLERELTRSNELALESFSTGVNQSLIKQETVVSNLAAVIAAHEMSPAELQQLVIVAQKSDPDYSDITVSFNDKRYFNSDGRATPPGYDPKERGWYKQIIGRKGVSYTDIFQDIKTKELMVIVGCPVVVDGTPIGVVTSTIDLNKLMGMTNDMKVGSTGFTFVVNTYGEFMTHPQFQPTDKISDVYDGTLKEFYDKANQASGTSVAYINLNGAERMVGMVHIGNTGWMLGTSVTAEELYAEITNMAFVFAASGMFVILLIGAIIWLITKKIAAAIGVMLKFSADLAQGDFREHPHNINSRDEIGSLADALVDMRVKLRDFIRQVHSSVEMVAAASQELTATTDQTAQVSTQIATSVSGVARGADEQMAAIKETTRVVDEMSKNSGGLEVATESVISNAAKAVAKTEQGNQAVAKVVGQMRNIKMTVGSSVEVVEELGSRSQEIGQIIDTISGIAGQTNLLALNAAIEAARAGEQGRGFAVVAEEVRKLAEQSQEATKHISDLIKKIQADTSRAVSAMQEGNREVQLGAEVVDETGRIFEEINLMINEVNNQTSGAQRVVKEISDGSVQIVNAMERIDKVSKDTAAETENVSAATEQQAASMHEMANASQELAKLAQSLQDEINYFKL